jgi:hypothetical protein
MRILVFLLLSYALPFLLLFLCILKCWSLDISTCYILFVIMCILFSNLRLRLPRFCFSFTSLFSFWLSHIRLRWLSIESLKSLWWKWLSHESHLLRICYPCIRINKNILLLLRWTWNHHSSSLTHH